MDISRLSKKLFHLVTNQDYRDYRYVRKLHVFDPGYYYRWLWQDATRFEDPLWSYFLGSMEHYRVFMQSGYHWRQLPDPHPLFDTAFYLTRYFPGGLQRNPFAHYLRIGWKQGLWPSPFFDPEMYAERSGWDGSTGDPLTHYTHHGDELLVSPSWYFDFDWYRSRNPILSSAAKGIIRYYKIDDTDPHKSPIPYFDSEWYLGTVPDRHNASRDPLSHYLTCADLLNLRPNEWLDPDRYGRDTCTGPGPITPLAHYLETGVHEKRHTHEKIDALPQKPLISLLMPVFNPTSSDLYACLSSVLYQAYPYWQLCIADDNSTDETVLQMLAHWAAADERISVVYHQENKGISAATNSAAVRAEGEYVGFLDHDDELCPDCLYHLAAAISETGADVFYSDEILVGPDGKRCSPFFKPSYNEHLLLSHNYITHFTAVKRGLFNTLGGLNSAYDGAQDYDLMLRLAECQGEMHHIQRILYRWRASQSSSSVDHSQKPYAHEAGKQALQEAVSRRGMSATAEDTDINFYYRLRFAYRPSARTTTTVLLRQPHGAGAGGEALAALKPGTGVDHTEFIVVDDDDRNVPSGQDISIETSAAAGRKATNRLDRNQAYALDRAIAASESEYIAIVSREVRSVSKNWLRELVAALQQNKDVAVVCGRLIYDGGDGISYTVPQVSSTSPPYFAEFLTSCSKHLNGIHCPQLVSLCSWDFCLIRRRSYEAAGGFDFTSFPSLFAMHDLSYQLTGQGEKILYYPFVTIETGGQDIVSDAAAPELMEEKRRFQQKWKARLQRFDRNYNTSVLDEINVHPARFRAWLSGEVE